MGVAGRGLTTCSRAPQQQARKMSPHCRNNCGAGWRSWLLLGRDIFTHDEKFGDSGRRRGPVNGFSFFLFLQS